MKNLIVHHWRLLKPDVYEMNTLSDLLINLSAGWYGAALIGTPLMGLTTSSGLFNLFINVIFGTITFALSVRIRKASISSD